MELYAGLMSGTSLDGIDVALTGFSGRDEVPREARLVAFRTVPYELAFRDRLRAACTDGSSSELCDLSFELGSRFADALRATLEEAGLEPGELAAVGCHGQTVWHAPPDAGSERGSTLQIGEGAVIAERLEVSVVEDFRVRDVAAGGQGAPLAAAFDRLLLGSPDSARAIQNLGGMANVTALPREGTAAKPIAFDTGPGIALLDGATQRLTAGELPFDEDGRLASRGSLHEAALEEWLDDPFFRTAPPRSTGRERFGDPALVRWLARHDGLPLEDVLATLSELTARTIADAYALLPFEIDEVYLCGGGARHAELARRIGERVAPLPVRPLAVLGWEGDAREAAAFALLARQHLLEIPTRLDWATGARGPRILGKRIPA